MSNVASVALVLNILERATLSGEVFINAWLLVYKARQGIAFVELLDEFNKCSHSSILIGACL